MVRRQRHKPAPSTAIALRPPADTHSEAYRVLRSNLNVVLSELERPTVVLTSTYAGEGKTSTCVNLARAMVLAGQRVVLVDMDLRHPDAHRWLGGHNEYGVSDVLLEQRPLDDALQRVEIGKGPSDSARPLYLLAAGNGVTNPAELLGTARAAKLLDALAHQADVVLIDTPPVLPVADTLVISRMVTGAMLIVETRRTPIGAVEQAKAALIRNQARLLGLVINKLQPRDADVGYGYGYTYGYDGHPSSNGG